jgi:hypothetical protein
MATLRNQFSQTLTNIEVNGSKAERAQAAHSEIRQLLERDATLCEWGIDTVLIGSYSRYTGIYPGKDVDVFTRLMNLDTDARPKDVFEEVRKVLLDAYGDVDNGGRASPQARSIKVVFGDDDDPNSDFAVDAVPAVRDGAQWAIPTKDRNRWAERVGRWVSTDPEKLGALSSALSTTTSSPVVGGRNAYKPIVKLMRQARRTHLGERRPGGLYIEIATYETWNSGLVSGDEWDTLFAQTLRRVSDRLASAQYAPLLDPALGTAIAPAPSEAELASAGDTFKQLAATADEALVADDCLAAAKWRDILGGNDRADPVFPLPPGCSADGTRNVNIAPVRTRGTDEARGFG